MDQGTRRLSHDVLETKEHVCCEMLSEQVHEGLREQQIHLINTHVSLRRSSRGQGGSLW